MMSVRSVGTERPASAAYAAAARNPNPAAKVSRGIEDTQPGMKKPSIAGRLRRVLRPSLRDRAAGTLAPLRPRLRDRAAGALVARQAASVTHPIHARLASANMITANSVTCIPEIATRCVVP